DGYLAKVSAFVPNMPSPGFAVLDKAPEPAPAAASEDAQALAEARPGPARGRSHDRRAHLRPRLPVAADADDVMAPSTW
ncbi:MAG TPA: beta-mannanase, partial [Polyangia bacterium]|nr:beta-mannanase [Polyangia bacterium]